MSSLTRQPKQGIYAIGETINRGTLEEKKVVYLAVVTSPIAWIARNAIDIAYDCHKYNLSERAVAWCEYRHGNIYLLRHKLKEICEDYVKKGYIVYSNKRDSTLKIKYVVYKAKVELRIITSRGKAIYTKVFEKMHHAKLYAKNNTIEEMLSEL